MLSIIGLLIFFGTTGQNGYDWWNEKHNWDGITPWKDYIINSPAKMGPNALPVPEINTGIFTDYYEFEAGIQQHFGIGDQTFNFTCDAYLPLAKGKAGLNIHYIPVEFYRMDSITRDERFARDYDGRGHSFGDVYFTTYIQALKDHSFLPDVLFTINLKTASGTNLENARHTDTPGYYFDCSFGKTFQTENKFIHSWRPYFMGGFYCYHTNRDDYLQNDAYLFGTGVKAVTSYFKIDTQFGGYIGYFENGDQPLVYRINLTGNTNSSVHYKFRYQAGLNDFPYHSFTITAVYRLKNK